MPISVVGTFAGSAINGGNVTITLPSMLPNDLVLTWGGMNDNLVSAGPSTSGYTTIIAAIIGAGSYNASYKVMGGSPDTSVTLLGSANVQESTTYVGISLRGIDVVTPIDVTTTTATGTSSAPDSPSITTVTNGCLILSYALASGSDSTVTAPSGFSNQTDITDTDTFNTTVGLATQAQSLAGAIDPGAWSTWIGGQWIAASIAIRPASSVVSAPIPSGGYPFIARPSRMIGY